MATPNYVRQLRKILKGTPLAPHARLIASVESRYKLPKGSIAGIAKAESSFGTAGSPARGRNAWGWTDGGPPNFRSFPNWQSAIRQYGRFLGESYGDSLRNGGPAAIADKYVGYSAPHWVTNVSSVMSQFGGGVPTAPAGNPGTSRGGQRGSRAPAAAGNDKMKTLLALIMMRRSSRSGGSSELMLPLIQTLLDTRPSKRPRPRGKDAGGEGPPSVQPKLYQHGKGFLLPVPGFRTSHATSNLAGYPAFDFMIPDNTPVYADFSGKVTRLSGHSGYSGGFGGRSYYITTDNGRKLFLTHFDYGKTILKPGQHIQKGQLLGYVQPGARHIHYGYAG